MGLVVREANVQTKRGGDCVLYLTAMTGDFEDGLIGVYFRYTFQRLLHLHWH